MNLEDCTRFFILAISPAHEGILALEQTRYSGFWGSATLALTYLPAPSHPNISKESVVRSEEYKKFSPDYLPFTPYFFRQWRCGGRPQLQRRDHAGFPPASLHPFRTLLEMTIGRTAYHCQANSLGISTSLPNIRNQ